MIGGAPESSGNIEISLKLLDNKILNLVLMIVLTLGIVMDLPEFIKTHRDNILFKLVCLGLVILFAQKNVGVAILMALYVVRIMIYHDITKSKENFAPNDPAVFRKEVNAPANFKLVQVAQPPAKQLVTSMQQPSQQIAANPVQVSIDVQRPKTALLSTPLSHVKSNCPAAIKVPAQSPCALTQQNSKHVASINPYQTNNRVPGSKNDCIRSGTGQFCTQGAPVQGGRGASVSGYSPTGSTFC